MRAEVSDLDVWGWYLVQAFCSGIEGENYPDHFRSSTLLAAWYWTRFPRVHWSSCYKDPETPQVLTSDPCLARNGQMEHDDLADFLKNKSQELRSLDARTPWGCAKRCSAMLRISSHMASQCYLYIYIYIIYIYIYYIIYIYISYLFDVCCPVKLTFTSFGRCWKLIWHDPYQDNWKGHDSMLCKRNKLGFGAEFAGRRFIMVDWSCFFLSRSAFRVTSVMLEIRHMQCRESSHPWLLPFCLHL